MLAGFARESARSESGRGNEDDDEATAAAAAASLGINHASCTRYASNTLRRESRTVESRREKKNIIKAGKERERERQMSRPRFPDARARELDFPREKRVYGLTATARVFSPSLSLSATIYHIYGSARRFYICIRIPAHGF